MMFERDSSALSRARKLIRRRLVCVAVIDIAKLSQ